MSKKEITPLDEWYESLEPYQLIIVIYSSTWWYFGAYAYSKKGALHYYDIPTDAADAKSWNERLENGNPVKSYITGSNVKTRVLPARSWMLTDKQKEYYFKLKKNYEY